MCVEVSKAGFGSIISSIRPEELMNQESRDSFIGKVTDIMRVADLENPFPANVQEAAVNLLQG
eukprot:5579659-Pyramimonas_sp.AAC.1